jgi:nucleoside-diphosphate-sugar epimerase
MRVHVIGASSPLGSAITRLLVARELNTACYSRRTMEVPAGARWFKLDLSKAQGLEALSAAPGDLLICAAPLRIFAATRASFRPSTFQRVVAVSSASAVTKAHSPWLFDREWAASVRDAERELIGAFQGSLTLLRPTLIYGSGSDRNVARLAQFVRRFRIVPLSGGGKGLRAPIHVEDLAAIIVHLVVSAPPPSPVFHAPGPELIPYHEMVSRIAHACGVSPWMPPVPHVPSSLARFLSRLPKPVARFAAAASRASEDLIVPDDVCDWGVPRRPFKPDARAVGLQPPDGP